MIERKLTKQTCRVRLGTDVLSRSCIFAAIFAVIPARAEILPLVNPEFEEINTTLSPGEMTNGMGGGVVASNTRWPTPFQQFAGTPQTGVVVQGWRSFVPTPPANALVGVLNPNASFSGGPWMTGYSGNYIAAAQAGQVQQTLNVQLQPNTTYSVRFLAGIGRSDFSYAPRVALIGAPDLQTLAFPGQPNVTTLTWNPWENIEQADFGVMRVYTFSYTTAAVLPANQAGRYLGISFLGSDGFPRVCFDDFEIEAMTVPEPSAGAGVAIGLMLAMRRRRLMAA